MDRHFLIPTEIVAVSKGLHIYSQYYELVETQLQMSIEQLRAQGQEKLERRFSA